VRLDSHTLAQLMCRPQSDVLDVGCGRGVVAERFVSLGCRVVGLDVAESAVEAMRERSLVAHVCDLDNDDLGSVLGDQDFDVIVCLDVLEHTKRPADVLAKLLAHLRPDGGVLISLPNVTHGDVRLSLLGGRFEYRDEGLLDATHLRFFDRAAVESLLEDCGLVMRDLHPVRFGLGQTELGVDLDEVSSEVVESVLADPDATIYQWVLRAQRAGADDFAPPLLPVLEELEERIAAQTAAERYNSQLSTHLAEIDADRDSLKEYVHKLEQAIADRDAQAELERGQLRETLEDLEFLRRELDAVRDVVEIVSGENDALRAEADALRGAAAELQAVKARRLYRLVDRLSRTRVVRALAR
jgi:2-polyprenyl-3-methyl-5-hydroxy-6-metoxy-1,4-benzoquinol methylase